MKLPWILYTMPKLTSADKSTRIRVVMITLDSHLSSTVKRAEKVLKKTLSNFELQAHVATDWNRDPSSLERCIRDIEKGDIIFVTMMFLEDHIQAVLPALKARRDKCDAMVGCMSAGEIVALTRMGRLEMGGKTSGAIQMLKRLRGSKKNGSSDGAGQMKMLRRLPKILKYIPGKAQDLRIYFLVMQYWLACSDRNLESLVRLLINHYAKGQRKGLRGNLSAKDPVHYPDTGLYHPRVNEFITEQTADLPKFKSAQGTVGLILMRSYILAGDTGHYDAVIQALESRGLRVRPIFASGLDIRPAVERYFFQNGKPVVDAVVSLTGFSLVGGPAYCDPGAAEQMLSDLDIPYIAAQALEFQSLDQWRESSHGLLPIESTIMVALPELDGATGSMVFGGRAGSGSAMTAEPERVETLVNRVYNLISLRKKPRNERKVALVVFNFPPNAGATGTAAHLDVFASIHNTLSALKADGYEVDIPVDAEALRDAVVCGNAETYGTEGNVAARINVDDHVRSLPWLQELEDVWGAAPGAIQTDGKSLFVLGAHFGNVFVGIQPNFGYEGDPMRLLFEKGFAPTHAFAAFYNFIRKIFSADAVLHFGTHGALEFMPGKQTGLMETCWPERLIGDIPNFYLYAANNPSEGMIAKRRSVATLVSYLTPPIKCSGLYNQYADLKATINRWRGCDPSETHELSRLTDAILVKAEELELVSDQCRALADVDAKVELVLAALDELSETLIPDGLHIVGAELSRDARTSYLSAISSSMEDAAVSEKALALITDGHGAEKAARVDGVEKADAGMEPYKKLEKIDKSLDGTIETKSLIRALDGCFIQPVVGGDIVRTPEILPTGRNIHGFDPFRLPSGFAMSEGAAQANKLIARYIDDNGDMPSSVALVLWGTDNMKTEGVPVALALALMGAKPRVDSFNKIVGAVLVPLSELGRPRIDVVMTMSGIFRDLLPMQMRMLAEAAYLAASAADEPLEQNSIRRNVLARQETDACDFETAALRVFSNADGAYGANLNHMVENGGWDQESELGDLFVNRKSFAFDRHGDIQQSAAALKSSLKTVDAAYQNLDGLETGITTLDQYFDSLGGIARAAAAEVGSDIPVYIGDQNQKEGKVRSLNEQVALETRTRALNPAWFEGMLKHGYEGVRQIEAHVTNTMGWSATTGQVDPWIYRELTETYMLDPEMRARLAELNSKASAAVANRLLEAHERQYWQPDDEMLDALRSVSEELEDRLEGVEGDIAA